MTADPPPAPILVDVYAAALHAKLTYDVHVSPMTIHQWACRGLLTRHGRREKYALVDLREIDQRLSQIDQRRDADVLPARPPVRQCRAIPHPSAGRPRAGRRSTHGHAGGGGSAMHPPPVVVRYMIDSGDVTAIGQRHQAGVDAGLVVGLTPPRTGETYPAVVVRSWPDQAGQPVANLQVLLDGGLTHWATNRAAGDRPGTWSAGTPQDTQRPRPGWHSVLNHFRYGHLPPQQQEVSARCSALALDMVKQLPDDPELTAGLRLLLQATDCFVRAAANQIPDQPR